MGFDDDKDFLARPMLLQQVGDGEDRGFIVDPIANQLDACKAAHGGNFDQCLLHRRIAEGIPLLQRMDPQNRGMRSGVGTPHRTNASLIAHR